MHKLFCITLPAILCACLASCVSKRSYISDMADLPLKDTKLPSMSWQDTPLRANAQYVLYGAQSGKEIRGRLGDYFFVKWFDATPHERTQVEFLYTQAITASKVLRREVRYDKPRRGRSTHKELFAFNGPERAKNGDILSWRLNLIVNGQVVDSRRSYLWKD